MRFKLNQFYDDRWRVLVDNRERPIVRANEFFMGIEVPPGQHRVKFIFRDRFFTIGLIISMLTGFGIALYMVFFPTHKGKKRETEVRIMTGSAFVLFPAM